MQLVGPVLRFPVMGNVNLDTLASARGIHFYIIIHKGQHRHGRVCTTRLYDVSILKLHPLPFGHIDEIMENRAKLFDQIWKV